MAETDQLVIELVADTSQFEPAIDSLEKLGAIDAKSAELLRKTNTELASRAKSLSEVASQTAKAGKDAQGLASGFEKAGQKLSNVVKNIVSGSGSGALDEFIKGVNDALKEAGISAEDLSGILQETFGKNNAIPETEKKVVSLRQQLKNMKNELASGNLSGEQFAAMSLKAAELEDRIGDVNLQVRNLASDTSTMDGLVQGIQGVTGAFQLAQGSAALFGVEAEELEQVQLRLVALLNISNGLQQIQTLLQRESATMLLVSNAQRKIQNLLVLTENGLQSKNVIVKGAATAAQWLLNAAMSANPAGLLVVAIGALAGALLYFSSKTESATEAQINLNKAQLEGLQTLRELEKVFAAVSNDRVRLLELEKAKMQAAGASALELAKIDKQIADERVAAALVSKEFFRDETRGIQSLRDDYQKLFLKIQQLKESKADQELIDEAQSELDLVKDRLNLEEKLRDDLNSAKIGQVQAAAAITKAEKEAAKERDENDKKRREREQQALIDRLTEEKAFIERSLLETEEGTDEALALKRALIQKESEINIASLSLTKTTEEARELIIAKANKEATDEVIKAEKERLAAQLNTLDQLNGIDANINQARLAQVRQGTEEELNLRKEAIEIQADQDKLAAQQRYELGKKGVTDKALFDSKILAIDAKTKKDKTDLDKEYYATKEELRKQELEAELAKGLEILAATTQVLSAIVQASAEADRQKTQHTLNVELSKLHKLKDTELSNKRLTEKQKEEINEKYAKKEAELKLKAWKANKEASKKTALIQGALAVVNAFATGGGWPAGLVAAAIQAALVAVQISAIDQQQPPEFAHGVEYLEGPGTKTSDSIAARLSVGERVVDADTNNAFWDTLHAIHNKKVDADAMNAFARNPGMFEMLPLKDADPSRVMAMMSGPSIDYQKLGKSVADNLWGDLDTLNDSVINSGKEQAALLHRLYTKPASTYNLRLRR